MLVQPHRLAYGSLALSLVALGVALPVGVVFGSSTAPTGGRSVGGVRLIPIASGRTPGMPPPCARTTIGATRDSPVVNRVIQMMAVLYGFNERMAMLREKALKWVSVIVRLLWLTPLPLARGRLGGGRLVARALTTTPPTPPWPSQTV
ncbi:MAG: hypothetical protein COV10_03835 [Candidatus Vogelbacteria bacterium CG10_big_fil_rev_8_21_14_0_10_51_16]|uniref:Uncharacterized protein n=1 Tax=Candidatus Vogelbacteria bacterium CG10_big_fil_rev_8_21_14_0_10_51_16 TaxID=1975045 RepID=A0A2H0RDR0_9BACT|nr:MAG: hypothetical protein COV10_03835 [Candidatus Vogelbacteria bacterium CG10_big_fil_rev_8_21_14_0_10_51_16]